MPKRKTRTPETQQKTVLFGAADETEWRDSCGISYVLAFKGNRNLSGKKEAAILQFLKDNQNQYKTGRKQAKATKTLATGRKPVKATWLMGNRYGH